jgi:hypothetical protein
MAAPEYVLFTPVPLRARCDGWSPALQLRFVRLLAEGMKPGAAAEAVGKNRQNAYALRKRPGAESFAAAWDAAIAFAARTRLELHPLPPARAVMPHGPDAEAIALRGRDAVFAARSVQEAAAPFDEMMASLYGPKNDNSDTSAGRNLPLLGSRTL